MITSYREYLLSKEWKAIAMECKRLAGNKCNRCDSTENLHAHHKTYDNIYNEKQEDLECLCTRCHNKEHGRPTKMRGGFNLIYHNPYEEIMELVVNSNKEMKLFNWVTNQFSKNRVETYVTFSVCKEDGIEISKRQFSEMVKILVREKYLMRIRRGIYRLNPFIYLPTMSDATSLQREWKELLEAQKQIKEK